MNGLYKSDIAHHQLLQTQPLATTGTHNNNNNTTHTHTDTDSAGCLHVHREKRSASASLYIHCELLSKQEMLIVTLSGLGMLA